MKLCVLRRLCLTGLAVGTVSLLSCWQGAAARADLRDAAPPDAFMALHTQHNPERDYMQQYYQEVWKTVQDTRVFERVLQMIQSRVGEADAQQFLKVREAITGALAPVEWAKLAKHTELLYAQRMEMPTSQQVLMLRIPDGGAASLAAGFRNLMDLAQQASDGAVTVGQESAEGFDLQILQLPREVPFRPAVAAKDDVFVIATTDVLAKECLHLLANPNEKSKFDDARFQQAISQLPTAEDCVIFFDGVALGQQLKQLDDFILRVSNNNPDAQRVADLLDSTIAQLDIVDYEVTVCYTEGYQNRTAAVGRLQSGVSDKVAARMVAGQKSFEDWKTWVPASASGFSLWSGFTLRPLYVWLMEEIPKAFPEAQAGLDQFAAQQDALDLHVDEDLLQAFSGEMASLTFPGKTATPLGKSAESIVFLRCQKPDRIRELIHRGINTLQEIPQVRAQGLGLKEVPGLDGFEEITANILGMAGIRPVIGFQDGWMVLASHPNAVQSVQATRSGDAPSFADSDLFKSFDLTVDGPVDAISYRNTGESTRQLAQGLQQAGMMLPMFIGMAGQQSNGRGPDLTIVQDLAALLPAIGRIVGKLDFVEKTLSVAQPGPEQGTWVRHTVTLIRPPAETTAPATKPGSTVPKNP